MSAPNDVVKRLTEVLAQADWIAQQPDEIACELLPVVEQVCREYAAEELRAIGRARLAAQPGADQPVRTPVDYLFQRADALEKGR